MPLKRYSKKEPQVFVWIMIPYIIFLNILIFGSCIFNETGLFFRSFFFTGVYLCLVYFTFGIVATFIQNRFPAAGDMFKRIAIMLPVFYILNGIAMTGVFYLYNNLSLLNCTARSPMLVWTIVYGCIMSTLITFINEGIANWEAWKASLTETERLKNAYQRSKVLGLRGQINPHFLFNCFNTLSGLIQHDEAKAEKFLNEMTKVHRYLLRSDDELLVSLDMEIKFAESYLYLAAERFGDSMHVEMNVHCDSTQKELPPLSLQVILENIIYTNALSKTDPLTIRITCSDGNELLIVNSVHKKIIVQQYPDDGLDNLLNKYKMLNTKGIVINENESSRTLILPLFDKKEAV